MDNNTSSEATCGGLTFFDLSNTIVIPVITAIGCLGNMSIAAVYLQSRNRRTCVACFITALAASNIAYVSAASTTFTVIPKVVALGPLLPFAFGMMHTSRTCVVWTYMMLMVDRAVALKWSLKHQVYVTVAKARLSLLTMVLLALVFNGTRFAELEAKYVQVVKCGVNVTLLAPAVRELRGNPLYIKIYLSWLCSILLYVVPFGVIATLNSTIYYFLRKHRFNGFDSSNGTQEDSAKKRGFSVKGLIRDRTRHGSVEGQNKGQRSVELSGKQSDRLSSVSSSRAKDPSITVMLFVEALVFLACNTMPLCLNIMETITPVQFDKLANRNSIFRFAISLNNVLALLNAGLTFFVFYVFGSKFRQQFRLLVSKIFCGSCAPTLSPVNHYGRSRSTGYANRKSYATVDRECHSHAGHGITRNGSTASQAPRRSTSIVRNLTGSGYAVLRTNSAALACSDV